MGDGSKYSPPPPELLSSSGTTLFGYSSPEELGDQFSREYVTSDAPVTLSSNLLHELIEDLDSIHLQVQESISLQEDCITDVTDEIVTTNAVQLVSEDEVPLDIGEPDSDNDDCPPLTDAEYDDDDDDDNDVDDQDFVIRSKV